MLEAKIRYQVACEEKAHHLVLQLMEPGITEDELVNAGLYLTPNHYQDITEERAISRICGYPVCVNQITKSLNQKYHISTKTNRVYDITDRKNFCSNECYKASVYYQKQISTSPLWSRKEEKPTPIDLLPKEMNRGAMGKEVINQQTEMYREAKRLREEEKKDQSRKEKTKEKESGTAETEGKERNMVKGDKNFDDLDLDVQNLNLQEEQNGEMCLHEIDKERNSVEKAKKNTTRRKHEPTVTSPVTSTSDDKQRDKIDRLMALLDKRKHLLGKLVQDEKTVTEAPSKPEKELGDEDTAGECDQPRSRIEAHSEYEENVIIQSKVTEVSETKFTPPVCVPEVPKKRKSREKLSNVEMTYLRMVCEILKEWITPETVRFVRIQSEEEEEGPSTSRTEMEAKMRDLCRRVDHQEAALDDLIGEEDTLEDQLPLRSPAPNYESLKKDTREFTRRIQDFFAAGKVIKEKEPDTQGPVYLPSVDTYDQMLIRRRIVIEQLNKVIPDLLSPLKLTIQDMFAEMKELVMTFRLTSSNIVFKPVEWSLVGVILLKLLSRRNLHVSCAFLNPSAVQYFSVFLGGIQETMHNVDLYVTDLLQQHNK